MSSKQQCRPIKISDYEHELPHQQPSPGLRRQTRSRSAPKYYIFVLALLCSSGFLGCDKSCFGAVAFAFPPPAAPFHRCFTTFPPFPAKASCHPPGKQLHPTTKQTVLYAKRPTKNTEKKPTKITTTSSNISTTADSSNALFGWFSLNDKEERIAPGNISNKDAANDTPDVLQPLVLLLFSQFILFLGVGAVIPSIPLYGKEIGLSGAANGVVISAPAVALLALAKFSGNFADTAVETTTSRSDNDSDSSDSFFGNPGRKRAMMIGMAVIVVSDIGTACAQSLPTLLVARLGLGAGRGVSEAGERGMLADLAGQVPSLRGRALAAQQAVIALGIAIGAPAGGVVIEQYGPRASFLCVSAAAFCALVLYAFLPETIGYNKESSVDDTAGQQQQSSTKEVVAWSTLLKSNQWRGLALCQCGASFGFACKIASIPILAAATLPGGAIGAGALLSAAGLSGLVGAPLGGFISDQVGSRVAAVASGLASSAALLAVPLALSPSLASSYAPWLQELILSTGGSGSDGAMATINTPIGDMGGTAVAFCSLVVAWSTAVAAQGPALTALAQELAPAGSEATSLALPRAAGDGTYIVAPFILGIAADRAVGMPGLECAVAGSAALLGSLALGLLGGVDKRNDSS